jgi:hypothetical protein
MSSALAVFILADGAGAGKRDVGGCFHVEPPVARGDDASFTTRRCDATLAERPPFEAQGKQVSPRKIGAAGT